MAAFGGQVPVCMSCRGRDLRPQASGDGLWPGGGEGIAWVCDDCHHIGAPLLVRPGDLTVDPRDRLFEAEADAMDGTADDEPLEPSRLARIFGLLLLLLGAAFVVPTLLALEVTIVSGDLMGIMQAMLPVVWLGGVGVALGAVGIRLARQRAPRG